MKPVGIRIPEDKIQNICKLLYEGRKRAGYKNTCEVSARLYESESTLKKIEANRNKKKCTCVCLDRIRRYVMLYEDEKLTEEYMELLKDYYEAMAGNKEAIKRWRLDEN